MHLKQIFLTLLVCVTPAYAIPSPDMVINAFASVAQIAGLLVAILSAMFLRVKRHGGTSTGLGSRWLSFFGVVAVLAILGNIWQYAHKVSAESRRIETNLWRKPADWDRTFSVPNVTSAELAARMARGEPMHLIDVREPEEFEVTHLPGAVNLRYADLLLGVRLPPEDGKPIVFVCDSGKRSGEICEQRTRLGLPCQVLEGGYPKWVRENRPVSAPSYGWRTRFTPLPRYAHDTVYLDTPEIVELMNEDHAQFIDVRNPEDFAQGHLPNALNLPMRGMASDALSAALTQLPRKPWVAACYDNRSCFHARVLGLKLSRLGHDFRGRYTLPHEYPIPHQITARGMWPRLKSMLSTAIDKAVKPLTLGLIWAASYVGGLVPAMLALLLFTRLPLAGLARKAQRDRLALRTIAAQTAQLRSHYDNDNFRFQRAVKQLHKQHGLTPWRNLAASLIQLLVFLICFAAVRAAAQWSNTSFLWLDLLREPDTTGALALTIGITACGLTRRLLADTDMHSLLRHALAAGVGLIMLWMSKDLAGAVNLYLLASMALLWLQQSPWRERVQQIHTWWRERPTKRYGLPTCVQALEHCTQPGQIGNKAWRQALMRRNGLPVPAAWVWSTENLADNAAHILATLSALGLNPQACYAVRSSSIAEDSATQSLAGMFHSELQVPWQAIPAAMHRVRASYATALNGPHTGGVIVQTMVDAEYAGVMFTRDPGNAGAMLIEWVAGLGESLASGNATPSALRLGRVSGLPLNKSTHCPIAMAPLVALAHTIEQLFGSPQDIEWAYAQGRFYILQARDIVPPRILPDTPPDARTLIEQERARLLDLLALCADNPDAPALLQTDMTAELPRPTPLSLSIMQQLRGDGGSTDRACVRLGLRWHQEQLHTPDVQSAFGQTFLLQTHAQLPPIGMFASFYLSRSASGIEAHFRNTFLPSHAQAMRWREVMDLKAMSKIELVSTFQTWTRQFIQEHYVEADVINIAAEFYARSSAKTLTAHPPSYIATPSLATHGHRALHDWELSEPRYHEDPSRFAQHFGAIASAPAPSTHAPKNHSTSLRLLDSSVQRSQAFARLKEDAKHALMREWAQLRRLLLELDQRLAWDGLLFYLELSELPDVLSAHATALRQRAQQRQTQAHTLRHVITGSHISVRELETRTDWLNALTPQHEGTAATAALKGLRVSGRQAITGPVRILLTASDLEQLRTGEIAVVALADPIWVGGFDRAAGLVSEVGGWLAHLAILAREQDLPTVFGVDRATQKLQSGDVVTLEINGSIQVVQRAH